MIIINGLQQQEQESTVCNNNNNVNNNNNNNNRKRRLNKRMFSSPSSSSSSIMYIIYSSLFLIFFIITTTQQIIFISAQQQQQSISSSSEKVEGGKEKGPIKIIKVKDENGKIKTINPFMKTSFHQSSKSQHSSSSFDGTEAMGFYHLLNEDAKYDIQHFDKLSNAMNITIAEFYQFMDNTLKQEDKNATQSISTNDDQVLFQTIDTDDEREDHYFDREIDYLLQDDDDDDEYDVEDEDFDLSNVARLLNINESAVDFVLQQLDMKRYHMMSAFDTVDTILVLMNFVTALENSGIELSIKDVIVCFCHDGVLEEMAFIDNMMELHDIKAKYVNEWLDHMDGTLVELEDDIFKITVKDVCDLYAPENLRTPVSKPARRKLRSNEN